jgi:predicted Ser/Thr protein kinase
VLQAAGHRIHSAGLVQGELATRISPAHIQSVSGFVAPEPEEIAPYFPQLEVLDILGRGGMGIVYKARQRELDRQVALKVLFPDATNNVAFGGRFLREARALARLSHPHIVAVHDIGRSAGLFYLIMEFVDGPNLRQLHAEQSLSLPQALAIVIDMCDALHYAHAQHIVHRDVKPDNILIDRKAGPKLVDFGIAKLAGRPLQETALTASREVMGTYFYIAPEQFERPREVDQRADIYALGVVLHELLTGELPMGRFGLPSQRAGTDPRLDRIVMQALEKQPERRYQRVLEMKAELLACLTSADRAVVEVVTHSRTAVPLSAAVHPAQFARGPAVSLLIAGLLATVGFIVLVGMVVGLGAAQTVTTGSGILGMFWKNAWLMLVGTAVGPLLIAAARRLEALTSYRFVYAVSVLAMAAAVTLPSLFNLLALPAGVWTLCTLCRKGMRGAFQIAPPLDRVERALLLLMTALVATLGGVLVFGT